VRPEILSGWKEIANYLGRGVRTVQRYEREFGLPVQRPSRKKQGSVLSTQSELDAWVADRLSGRQAFVSLKRRTADMGELSKRILEIREMLSEPRQRIPNETKRERTKE
jgi:hypothetical protein